MALRSLPLVTFVILLLGSVALAPPAAAQEPVKTNQVELKGNAFIPSLIQVTVDDTVTWTHNDTVVQHSVTSDAGGNETFDHDHFLGVTAGGLNKFSFKFTKVGVTKYHCKYHSSMVGEVRVVAAGTSGGGNNTTQPPPLEHDVSATNDSKFVPQNLSIAATESVKWTNTGTITHNVVFEDSAIGTVGELPAGASVNHTFESEGTYKYRCTYHSTDFSAGMIGQVQVGPPPPPPPPGGGNNPPGANPPTIRIQSPADGATVSGNVEINGTAAPPASLPTAAMKIEVRIGDNGNWVPAEVTGTGAGTTWSYTWETSSDPDGDYTLYARATMGSQSGQDSIMVVLDNAPEEGSKKRQPGFEAFAVAAAVVGALAFAARRRA